MLLSTTSGFMTLWTVHTGIVKIRCFLTLSLYHLLYLTLTSLQSSKQNINIAVMSIDAEHQSTTQPTVTTSDSKGESKMIRKVHQSMTAGDEGEVHHRDADEENFGGGDEGAQDAKDGTDRESFSDGETLSLESSEPQPADESPNSSSQGISHQQTSPDWRRGDIADSDDECSSGEDDTARKWTDLSPVYKSRKRPREVEEEDETNNPEDSPRKKFVVNPQSLPKPKYNRVRQNSEGEPELELYVPFRFILDVDDQFRLYHY
ncbi:hypothetical protein CY34DRAFT_740716 [Suillus luteus UH-Slu-Lm8-n1]|uniref:Uncharacterized protein n=1 Tax=Suillus luteus UH-Slu-Lm8-n1 TaxID=930992 RepID=A0A0D0A488_9AGAM|nr:hypothetical protein CY34DRAFT_740716 [Suillus luteus UH-Slu-Lm8-n1]